MPERAQKPPELKALCLAFVLWSALSLAASALRWSGPVTVGDETSYSFPIDFGVFGFLAAIGLWRLSRTGRVFALVLTWYWLAGSVLLFFELFPTKYVRVTSNTDFLAAVPRGFLRAFVVPFFLLQLWQLRALTRPTLRALFDMSAANSARKSPLTHPPARQRDPLPPPRR